MEIRVHADNTITLQGKAVPFAKIDRDSYKMKSGQRGKTTVHVYATGSKIEMTSPLYAPAIEGSVSDWKINPDFQEELAKALA